MEKTEKTDSVITSWMVLSCAVVKSYEPMRFAGTWKQYSKKAIPQLARMTFQSASLRNFKWPYHAKVMKILDTMSNRIVRIGKGAPCTVLRYRLETRKDSPKLLFPQMLSAGLHATALPSRFLFMIP